MTGLTTHVLDTALGKPAQGLRIQLMRMTGEEAELIKTVFTNDDGRVDGGPMLIGDEFQVGQYELLFHAGALQISVAHYHVPLVLSPYGYSTYRGS